VGATEKSAGHGGGFYHNPEIPGGSPKSARAPDLVKWESYVTWPVSFRHAVGVVLAGAEVSYLIEQPHRADISAPVAISIYRLLDRVFGWIIYDLLCKSPIRDFVELHRADRWL